MRTLLSCTAAVAVATLLLAVSAAASGRTAKTTSVRHLKAPIEALALAGGKVAYYEATSWADKHGKVANRFDRVVVWDVLGSRTKTVSGHQTRLTTTQGSDLAGFQVAMTGGRVAWITSRSANTSSDSRLFVSSIARPRERHVATVTRGGDCPTVQSHCAGTWLGGLVAAGRRIFANRWTTDDSGSVATGALDVLRGTKLRRLAAGRNTVEAVDADGGRIAVLRSDGTVGLYSFTGKELRTVSPTPPAAEVAISGRTLVVLRTDGTLAVYDSRTGRLRKTLKVAGDPAKTQNLDVQGAIAVYSTGCRVYRSCRSGAIHAVNLRTGKTRVLGRVSGGVGTGLAAIDKVGLVYAGNGWGAFKSGNATLVFVPFARVAAAVS